MKLHHDGNRTTAVGQRVQHSAGRFLCFKPIGVEFEHVRDKALFYEDKEIKIDSNGGKALKRKGFSRALKSILFRSKSRTKKSENREGEGSCSFRFGKRSHESESDIGLTKLLSMRSTSSSCSPSSSCSSSQYSESPTMSKISPSSNSVNPKPLKRSSLPNQSSFQKQNSLKKRHQQQQKGFRGSPMVMGVVLIMISLTLTVFWGRLWAIGLNAVWLCSIPKQGRSRSKKEDVDSVSLMKTTSLHMSFDSEFSVVEQKRRDNGRFAGQKTSLPFSSSSKLSAAGAVDHVL